MNWEHAYAYQYSASEVSKEANGMSVGHLANYRIKAKETDRAATCTTFLLFPCVIVVLHTVNPSFEILNDILGVIYISWRLQY